MVCDRNVDVRKWSSGGRTYEEPKGKSRSDVTSIFYCLTFSPKSISNISNNALARVAK